MGQNTKIDWADSTWNPVTGCLHGCEYCYARGIANRFGGHLSGTIETIVTPTKTWSVELSGVELEKPLHLDEDMGDGMVRVGRIMPYPYDFLPTLHRYKLETPQKWKKPRNIFVCSMADLFGAWVPDEWIKAVFDACLAAPQHRYLFLTKNPKRYRELDEAGLLPRTIDCWWGASTPHKADKYNIGNHSFVSIEPILEDFTGATQLHAQWVIIGAETGNRKSKVIPKRDWIMPFVEYCADNGTPVFMKESLREIVGLDFRQEFPWEDGAWRR